jgi:hypothetical protein
MDIVRIDNLKDLQHSQFDKEKDLSIYIESHIKQFCNDILEDDYVNHETEVQKSSQIAFMPRMPRVDYRIECKQNTYLIELKNPTGLSENRSAIGQILSYATMLNEDFKLVIITTKFDILTAQTIKKFNLPITYLYFENNRVLEFVGEME